MNGSINWTLESVPFAPSDMGLKWFGGGGGTMWVCRGEQGCVGGPVAQPTHCIIFTL